MKHIKRVLLFLITTSYTALSPASTMVTEPSLALAFGRDWAPYVYKNESGDADGQDYMLLNKVLASMGYKLDIVEQPEQRMTLNIEKGMVDVTLGAAQTEQRQRSNYFSIPYRSETIVFGYRKSQHPSFHSMSIYELLKKGHIVAMNHSAWFGYRFEHEIKSHYATQLMHAEGTERRMSLLDLGRVDAIIGDRQVLEVAAKKLGIDDFETAPFVINQTPVHFMFSQHRVNTDFITEFNHQLRLRLPVSD